MVNNDTVAYDPTLHDDTVNGKSVEAAKEHAEKLKGKED